jgi:tetratricopeptide (TPR) repeat protein
VSIHYESGELKRKFPAAESPAFARHGEALFREGRTEEAFRILKEGVKLHPGYLTGFLVLGRVYKEMGHFTESRTQLENVLRLDGRCPAARDLLSGIEKARREGPKPARVAARVDHLAKAALPIPAEIAEEDFEEEDGGGVEALPHVATVTLAEIYFQQGLKEQALQIYRQLLERHPEDETVRKRLGEIEASTV